MRSGQLRDWPRWRKALGVAILVLLILLLINPEFFVFAGLLDVSMLDILITLLGIQLLLYSHQIRAFAHVIYSAISCRLGAPQQERTQTFAPPASGSSSLMIEWTGEIDGLPGVDGRRFRIRKNGECLTFAAVTVLLKTSTGFRTFFNDALAGIPFEAFRWETPPVTRGNTDRPFECVALESPELLCPPEPDAFEGQFNGRRAPEVLGFPNLGNDAFMVVPCPGKPLSAYAHLGAFVHSAPEEQRDRLWQKVGEALDMHLGTAPVWLNTAGGAVAWLHVRLDNRPKYYRYAPYRTEQA